MSNFSLSQLVILLIIIFLVFGDFSKIQKNIKTILNNRKLQATKKKHRKKGS